MKKTQIFLGGSLQTRNFSTVNRMKLKFPTWYSRFGITVRSVTHRIFFFNLPNNSIERDLNYCSAQVNKQMKFFSFTVTMYLWAIFDIFRRSFCYCKGILESMGERETVKILEGVTTFRAVTSPRSTVKAIAR